MLTEPEDFIQLDKLEQWAKEEYQKHYDVFKARKAHGFIRSCHGDIHLGNIILFNNHPIIFDCIEFNEEFRWTDTMADIGFIAMDLEDNHRFDYARQLINTYFQYSGDYEGLKILPFYIAYRAMVRAKISLFRLAQPGITTEEKQAVQQKYRSCTALAERYIKKSKLTLMITYGVSGSGKSSLAKLIVEEMGAIQIRSDIERKRLFGFAPNASSESALNANIYTPESSEKTYAKLTELAKLVLEAGYSVVVDTTFLKEKHRNIMRWLAEEKHVPFIILHTHAPKEKLAEWIQNRMEAGRDVSEANLEVLQMQLDTIESLTLTEQVHAIEIDTSKPFEKEDFFQKLNQLIRQNPNFP